MQAFLPTLCYTAGMNELHQLLSKLSSSLPSITERKLYGRVAFYYKETALVVIDGERLALHIEKIDQLPSLKQAVTPWQLDGRPMNHWYLLPSSYNKKKNKVLPAIEQAISTWNKSKRPIKQAKTDKAPKKEIIQTQATANQSVGAEQPPHGVLNFFRQLFK